MANFSFFEQNNFSQQLQMETKELHAHTLSINEKKKREYI